MGRCRTPSARRGSTYLLVLCAAIIVTVIGLSAVLAARIQLRSNVAANDVSHARAHARSGLEMAALLVNSDPAWRQNRLNGNLLLSTPLGQGAVDVYLDHEVPDTSGGMRLLLTAVGRAGQARHMTRFSLAPVYEPLECLGTCVHSALQLHVKSGRTLAISGAPASTKVNLRNDGAIVGDAHAAAITGSGTISGTLVCPAPAKQMPPMNVPSTYIAKATPIPYQSTLEKFALGPGHNPWGEPNPDGLYVIHTGGKDITIKHCRIEGTLIVNTGGGKKLLLDEVAFISRHRRDYPALIVLGNLEMKLKSGSVLLDESADGVNFNPSGVAFGGLIDNDVLDVYPNEVNGLVYVTGSVLLKESTKIAGTLIVADTVVCEGAISFIHDSSILKHPPEGFGTATSQYRLQRGSFKQHVE